MKVTIKTNDGELIEVGYSGFVDQMLFISCKGNKTMSFKLEHNELQKFINTLQFLKDNK